MADCLHQIHIKTCSQLTLYASMTRLTVVYTLNTRLLRFQKYTPLVYGLTVTCALEVTVKLLLCL